MNKACTKNISLKNQFNFLLLAERHQNSNHAWLLVSPIGIRWYQEKACVFRYFLLTFVTLEIISMQWAFDYSYEEAVTPKVPTISKTGEKVFMLKLNKDFNLSLVIFHFFKKEESFVSGIMCVFSSILLQKSLVVAVISLMMALIQSFLDIKSVK